MDQSENYVCYHRFGNENIMTFDSEKMMISQEGTINKQSYYENIILL